MLSLVVRVRQTIAMSAAFALTAVCGSALAQSAQLGPQGRWVTASGNLEVIVAPCGDALCGTVAKVLANNSMSRGGEQMVAVDTRPAMGMKILSDFKPDELEGGKTVRWVGEIYNRENGKTYACQMSMSAKGELVVHPYVVLPLFGKTQLWQRVADAQSSDSR
jgi:uncharacterized protein (DUF2147 family)